VERHVRMRKPIG